VTLFDCSAVLEMAGLGLTAVGLGLTAATGLALTAVAALGLVFKVGIFDCFYYSL